VFDTEEQTLKVLDALAKKSINPRRYFYPSLNKLKWGYGQSCPISEDLSERILCLPSHDRVTDEDVSIICTIIERTIS
jgi:dTDP-4-amino-4,6-dideoxygalactose transaminase